MVSDDDIYRAAARIIKNTGDGAAMACAELVDRWERRGDHAAAEVWRRVLTAVRELEDTKPN